MTKKEMTKNVFLPQAIVMIIVLAVYIIARLIGTDQAFAVFVFAVFVFAVLVFAVFAVTFAAFDAFVFVFAAAAFTFAAVPAAFAAVTFAAFAFAAFDADDADDKNITKRQKVVIIFSYLLEFAIIFSAIKWILPLIF